jgi:hypothetical protein
MPFGGTTNHSTFWLNCPCSLNVIKYLGESLQMEKDQWNDGYLEKYGYLKCISGFFTNEWIFYNELDLLSHNKVAVDTSAITILTPVLHNVELSNRLPVITVSSESSHIRIKGFPNTFEKSYVSLYSTTGRLIRSYVFTETNSIFLNDHFTSGLYLIKLENGSFKFDTRVMVHQ